MYEELIKRLREKASRWCINCCYREGDCICAAPDYRKKDCDICSKLEAADAIEALSKKKKTTHWIPVTERLPRMYQQCWAACKMEGRENWVIEVQNYGIPYKKNPWGDCVLLESGEMQVYAWMPIDQPEPPKEDKL